jgi:hypothetical protein
MVFVYVYIKFIIIVFWGAGGRVSAGLMAGERGVTFSSPLPSKGLARQKPALHHVSPQRVYSQPAPPAPPVAHPPNAAASAAAAARKPADAAILLQNVEKNKQAPSAAVTKKSVRLEQEVSAEAPPREPAAPEWMKPKRATKPPPKPLFEPRKSGRPSLSEQLAGLSAKTETITAGIKQSLVKGEDDGKEAAKLLCQCDRFVVGRVKGTFSSPVQFFGNRLLYAFIHPTKERIEMRMMYEHMSEIRLDDAAMTFRFRIRKPIGTTFYGEGGGMHALSRAQIHPCIRASFAPFFRTPKNSFVHPSIHPSIIHPFFHPFIHQTMQAMFPTAVASQLLFLPLLLSLLDRGL